MTRLAGPRAAHDDGRGPSLRCHSDAIFVGLPLKPEVLEPDSEAGRMLAEARDELAGSVSELRDLARGLHPAMLGSCGLAAAVESLAARSAVPVSVTSDVQRRARRSRSRSPPTTSSAWR
jgi:signal transduction histidine kinase